MGLGTRLRTLRQSRRKSLRVALVGGGPEADLLAGGYRGCRDARLVAAVHPDPAEAARRAGAWGCETHCASVDELLYGDRIDAVELLSPLVERAERASKALAAGVHVSVLKPAARTVEEVRALVVSASASEAFFRVNDPLHYYPPYVKAREMVRAGEIGEVGSIRIKTTLGRPGPPATFGAGGGWPWPDDLAPGAPPGKAAYLFNLCVDKFGLAIDLAGEVGETAAYLNEIDGEQGDQEGQGDHGGKGGQGLVIWRCKDPGRYGVMEIVRAPELQVRSDFYPCDDTVEISGTDGILWVNRCTGRMTEAPAMEIRRGRAYYTIGVERGLRTGWADAWADSAEHFVTSILKGTPPEPGADAARQALLFLLAARQSAVSGTPIDPGTLA